MDGGRGGRRAPARLSPAIADQPPPPPDPAPPGRRGIPGWAWGLIALAVVVLVGLPLLLAARSALQEGSTPTGDPTDESTSPQATTPDDRSPTAAPGDGSDDGGFLDSLVEDTIGADLTMAQLTACLGLPPADDEPLPDDPVAAIAVITDQVVEDRQLSPTGPIEPTLLSGEDLAARVVELTERDYSDEAAEADARLLTALGALQPATDLKQLTLDLLGEQVAGFYDPTTGELVGLAGEGLDPLAQVTLAHEIDHALTDQALGLPDLDGYEGRADELAAAQAVVEGDATLLMQQWAVRHLSFFQQLGLSLSAGGTDTAQLEQAPHYLQQALLFPYTAGFSFACKRYADAGGWTGVDAAYESLPTTSAQILWPERYRGGEAAVDVPDPALPAGFEEVRRDQVGAADLLWLFRAPGDDPATALDRVDQRARAWAGGEVVVGVRGSDTAVAITLAEHADATVPLCDSVTLWQERTLDVEAAPGEGGTSVLAGTDRTVVVQCDDSLVHLAIGPHDTTTTP